MTRFKVLGAICIAASLAVASPALAGGGHFGGGHGGFHGGGRGFGPGIAAGIIAGSVLGAAAYGGAGYYGDSYAYDPGPAVAYGGSYGAYNPNGFVCEPGTVFRGEDGRRHLCQ